MPSAFTFTVGTVTSGRSFNVSVTAAPCSPVTVTLSLNGLTIDVKTVVVPGSATFDCPSNTEGQTWMITVSCPGGASDYRTGLVQ